jgi:hypothetical protein
VFDTPAPPARTQGITDVIGPQQNLNDAGNKNV